MRITDRMIVNHTLSYLQRGRQRLGDAQTRVVTGRNLLRSSDDPAQVERAMTLASELRMVQKQTNNLKMSREWLAGTDGAIDQLNDLVIKTRNVALRGINDTFSESERMAMSSQIEEILQNGLSIANTQQAGNYLFSGQQIKTIPFALKDNTILYQGDNALIQHQVELGQTMPINITGVSGKSGGILNVLTQIQSLQKNLAENNKAGIQSFLDNIDIAADDLHTDQSAVGVRIQRIDTTGERLATRESNLKQLYSQIVDADMAEVIAEMSAEEKAYEMSLATTARVMPRSLLDFLR